MSKTLKKEKESAFLGRGSQKVVYWYKRVWCLRYSKEANGTRTEGEGPRTGTKM